MDYIITQKKKIPNQGLDKMVILVAFFNSLVKELALLAKPKKKKLKKWSSD